MPPRRLLLAFAVSLSLHAAVLAGGLVGERRPPPPARALLATLRLPAASADSLPLAEPLLKNTLASEPAPVTEAPPPPLPIAAPAPSPRRVPPPLPPPEKAAKRQLQAAQKKLAEHLYYPPAAIASGLEGEVRLILSLADDGSGSISDVHIAASSGHAVLDQAAVKAAFAMGRLPGVSARELILPVIFRLQ